MPNVRYIWYTGPKNPSNGKAKCEMPNFFWHIAIGPSYIWDGTVAEWDKKIFFLILSNRFNSAISLSSLIFSLSFLSLPSLFLIPSLSLSPLSSFSLSHRITKPTFLSESPSQIEAHARSEFTQWVCADRRCHGGYGFAVGFWVRLCVFVCVCVSVFFFFFGG